MPLRALILEDQPSDAELMAVELRLAGFDLTYERAEDEAEFLALLATEPDIILADYTLPQFSAPQALAVLRKRGLTIPFVVVTGNVSEEAAVECMKQGADDYLLKDRLKRLGPAVAAALEQRRLREDRRQSERRVRATRDLLEHFATKSTRKEYLDSVVEVIHGWSGCRRVGIRVRDEQGAIPYESCMGFSKEFLDQENSLSLERDDCVCIRVAAGKIEPQDKPVMTSWGSFRTEDAQAFVAALAPEQQARFRGACIRQGFASLAVVPIRYRGITMGAIHLADERPAMTSLPCVAFVEAMAPLIGEAIYRFNVEEQLRRNYVALEQRSEQLRALASELTQAEERTRRQLAQMLHDHLQQLLVGARFSVGGLRKQAKSPRLGQAIERVEGLLDEAVEASRSLAFELSPPILYNAGLGAALEWLAGWVKTKHGLDVETQVHEGAEPASEEIRVLLFQCARELLFNVAKHAGVNSARIALSRGGDGTIQIAVADDGTGFDPAALQTREPRAIGFGLFSIRERLELLGGRLVTESAPGRGSRITLAVPSPPPQPGVGQEGDEEAKRAGDAAEGGEAAVIRVLLADDHKVTREGVARLLQMEKDIKVVGQVSDGVAAVEMARQARPDVVIMDVSMPMLGGVDAARRIVADHPGVRVIGLSMYEEADRGEAMRAAGAVAYLNKGCPAESLLAAIRGGPRKGNPK